MAQAGATARARTRVTDAGDYGGSVRARSG